MCIKVGGGGGYMDSEYIQGEKAPSLGSEYRQEAAKGAKSMVSVSVTGKGLLR